MLKRLLRKEGVDGIVSDSGDVSIFNRGLFVENLRSSIAKNYLVFKIMASLP